MTTSFVCLHNSLDLEIHKHVFLLSTNRSSYIKQKRRALLYLRQFQYTGIYTDLTEQCVTLLHQMNSCGMKLIGNLCVSPKGQQSCVGSHSRDEQILPTLQRRGG